MLAAVSAVRRFGRVLSGGRRKSAACVRIRAVTAASAIRANAARASSLASASASRANRTTRLSRANTSSWQEVNITRGSVNPLIDAVKHGDRDGVFKIGSDRFRANVDGSDSSRVTALMYAAKNGDVMVARYLVHALRADVRRRDADHSTALHYAAKFHHPAIVQVLLDAGSSPADADAWGRTPLHWAAMTGDTETCQLLCGAGAPLDVRDKGGHTPVNVAANVDQLHICALIKQTQRDRVMAAASSPPTHTATANSGAHSVTIGCYPDAHHLPPAPANAEREPSDALSSAAAAKRRTAIAAAAETVVKAEAARAAWIKAQCNHTPPPIAADSAKPTAADAIPISGTASGGTNKAVGQHYGPAHCDESRAAPHNRAHTSRRSKPDAVRVSAVSAGVSTALPIEAVAAAAAADPDGSVERGWWCDDMNPPAIARLSAEEKAYAAAQESAPAIAAATRVAAGAVQSDAKPTHSHDSDVALSWDGSRSDDLWSDPDGLAAGSATGTDDAPALWSNTDQELWDIITAAEAEVGELEERVALLEDDLRMQSRRIDHLVVRLSRVGTGEERDHTDRSDDDLPRTPR